MAIEIHSFLLERFEAAVSAYLDDLAALDDVKLGSSFGGVARTAFDFTYEVSYVHRRFAKRIRGETPEPMPDGWMVAPDEFRKKDSAMAEFRAAADDLVSAWRDLDAAEVARSIPLPSGESTYPADLMALATYHCGYHDAQLNYIQALHGDGEMHWAD